MAALDYLRGAGLAVELEGERLRVTPADRITADLRQFVRDHRAELLAELSAANDAQPASEPPQAPAAPTPAPAAESAPEAASEPTRNAWTITRGGKPICRMVGAPCIRSEALADARWRWPDADILEN
ncbi:hypothetical protein KRX52_07800 [Pseudomonas sp. MAP12]|uniref:TubC N-terminal docking domain-containing protein n=1 Tax=Geopseudomonas aromaticivorans TaxID=2849492 RepID=A0ABS6MWR7_9GAMM|nr:hypothetical protein [Pseudomonas aromaticivorans]MBV2132707.1 hypothetical protein [Pseudomonas aromaticivorans]